PIRWDYNFLRVDSDGPDLSAALVADAAERLQGGAGLKHRKVHVDDEALGQKLTPGFKELGWIAHHLIVMEHAGDLPQVPAVEVREVTFEDLRPSFERWDVEVENNSPEDATILAASKVVDREATSVRYLAALLGEEVAGFCELYSGEGLGQIENVCTFDRFRNRGVARAVVLRALRESASEGNDLHFLIADDDDWPKRLYEKLGFRGIGFIDEYLLKPD
ncbi:MAG TPA: GNAT family N-acetyltransferase, partial [Actinomycetota bacterium]|nr:GNAT family N-acetyltransferase [Actinomycetota bacterium]